MHLSDEPKAISAKGFLPVYPFAVHPCSNTLAGRGAEDLLPHRMLSSPLFPESHNPLRLLAYAVKFLFRRKQQEGSC